MTTQPTPAALRQLLLDGARADGVLNAHAAMHILVNTELPNAPWFARDHVKIATRGTIDGPVRGAWVRSWDDLLADPEEYLSGSEWQLVAIAASFACGRRVDLSAQVTMGLGRAGAQLVAKTVLIAAGAIPLQTAASAGPSAGRHPGLPGDATAHETTPE